MKAIISDIGGVMVQGNNMKTHYEPLIKLMNLSKEKFFKSYTPEESVSVEGQVSS